MSSLNHIITKPDLVKLLESNHPPTLIDVRGPDEVAGGMIPTAQNIPGKFKGNLMFPVDQLESALHLSDSTFLDQYKFPKPRQDAVIVFYCRSGRRGNRAWQISQDLGYTNALDYSGSWNDWTAS